MVFLVVNVVACVALIWASFNIDTRYGIHKSTHYLINIILFCATLFAFMAVLQAVCFWAPERVSLTVGRIVFLLALWFPLYVCKYMFLFPQFKKHRSLDIISAVLMLFAFCVFFFVKGGFVSLTITMDGQFVLESEKMFGGAMGQFLPISWFAFIASVHMIVVPLVTLIVTLVRSENAPSLLDSQRLNLNVLGLICFWFSLLLIAVASLYIPIMRSVAVLSFVPCVLLVIRAASTYQILDINGTVRAVLRIVFKYIIPAVFVSLTFFIMWPLQKTNLVLFITLWILLNLAFNLGWHKLVEYLLAKDFMRDLNYYDAFERELLSIDYTGSAKEVPEKLFKPFKKYVTVSDMNILLDSGEGMLDTVWSSNEKTFSVPMENPGFDILLNIKHPVVFKDWLGKDYNIASAREDLLKLLSDTGAESFILLSEGHRIIGLLLLYKKLDKNIYLPYDYTSFTKLYPQFFLAAYYIKNMLNESVVGTVNREIRMSGQIITSIQENMDFIKSPKVDTGYMMIPAHNIGGEFIDMIRLTETRHIIVIGSMSGKGIAASMNMVILKSVIRTFLSEIKDFKQLVEKVNLFIRDSLPKGSYFAGLFCLVDYSNDTLYYINCGSPALFVYTKAYNNVIEVQGEGHILGFAKDISAYTKVKKVKLAPGDVVMTCTDGLIETESIRNEAFGKERVQKILLENLMYPASKIAKFTYDSLVKFTSKELEDDITVFVMKYLGGK